MSIIYTKAQDRRRLLRTLARAREGGHDPETALHTHAFKNIPFLSHLSRPVLGRSPARISNLKPVRPQARVVRLNHLAAHRLGVPYCSDRARIAGLARVRARATNLLPAEPPLGLARRRRGHGRRPNVLGRPSRWLRRPRREAHQARPDGRVRIHQYTRHFYSASPLRTHVHAHVASLGLCLSPTRSFPLGSHLTGALECPEGTGRTKVS